MNRIIKPLTTVSVLFAMHTSPAMAVETTQSATLELVAPSATKPTSAEVLSSVTTPTADFRPQWIAPPGAKETIPELHIRLSFFLDSRPDAAVVEWVVGTDSIVKLNGVQLGIGDEDEDSVDVVRILPDSFHYRTGDQDHNGLNLIEILGYEVSAKFGAIALLQVHSGKGVGLTGTTVLTEVSTDGVNWKLSEKKFDFGDSQTPVSGPSDEDAATRALREYARRLVDRAASSDPEIAAASLSDLTRLTLENASSPYTNNLRLATDHTLWTLLDELLVVLSSQLQHCDRTVRMNALRCLGRVLEADTSTSDILARTGFHAMCDGSLNSFSEPIVLSSLLKTVTASSTVTGAAAQALKTAKAVEKAAENAIADAGKDRGILQDQLNEVDNAIAELEKAIGQWVAQSKVAGLRKEGHSQSIRTDQKELQKLEPQDPKAIALRKQVRDNLQLLEEQERLIGSAEATLTRLQVEVKAFAARRIPLQILFSELDARVAETEEEREAAKKQVTKIETGLGGLSVQLVERLDAISGFLDLNQPTLRTPLGKTMAQELRSVILKARLDYYGIEIADAAPGGGSASGGVGAADDLANGARVSATGIPTATSKRTVRHRPGVTRTAPHDVDVNPRNRSVRITDVGYPLDEASRADRMLRVEVKAAPAGVRGADSPVAKAAGAEKATSALPSQTE
jgi:hypothetical protein